MRQSAGALGDTASDCEPEERLLYAVVALALKDAVATDDARRADALAYLTGSAFAADVNLLGIDRPAGELLSYLLCRQVG